MKKDNLLLFVALPLVIIILPLLVPGKISYDISLALIGILIYLIGNSSDTTITFSEIKVDEPFDLSKVENYKDLSENFNVYLLSDGKKTYIWKTKEMYVNGRYIKYKGDEKLTTAAGIYKMSC